MTSLSYSDSHIAICLVLGVVLLMGAIVNRLHPVITLASVSLRGCVCCSDDKAYNCTAIRAN